MVNRRREEYKLHNEILKEEFLAEYKQNTQVQIKRLLSEAYEMETLLGKDIVNFNFMELEEFLKGLNMKSIQSAYKNVSYLRKYVEFAISKKLAKVNHLKMLKGTEILHNYVSNVAETVVGKDNIKEYGKYITRAELHNIINFCINAQDGAMYGLLYEGVYGVELEEIRNLKPEDCNLETGNIVLTYFINKEKHTRTIQIKDSIILGVLEDAINQKIYEKNNGINEHLRTPRFALAETGYVFRVSGREDYGTINFININNRLKKVAEVYGNPFLNPKTIYISGMIDHAKEIKEKHNLSELYREHYETINERFGYDIKYWYNTKRWILNHI